VLACPQASFRLASIRHGCDLDHALSHGQWGLARQRHRADHDLVGALKTKGFLRLHSSTSACSRHAIPPDWWTALKYAPIAAASGAPEEGAFRGDELRRLRGARSEVVGSQWQK